MYPPNLKSVVLPVSEIRGVAKLQTPISRKGRPYRGSGSWTFRTLDYSYPGLFVPSMDYSYLGLFVLWTVRTLLDCSYRGLFVPSWTVRTMDCSYRPWTFRTLDCLYHGLFVPSLDDSYHVTRLTKINTRTMDVSYENVPVYNVALRHQSFCCIFI